MKLDEAIGKVKAFIWDVQDRWDAFRENQFQTHLSCAVAGTVIGFYLAYLVWHK